MIFQNISTKLNCMTFYSMNNYGTKWSIAFGNVTHIPFGWPRDMRYYVDEKKET